MKDMKEAGEKEKLKVFNRCADLERLIRDCEQLINSKDDQIKQLNFFLDKKHDAHVKSFNDFM